MLGGLGLSRAEVDSSSFAAMDQGGGGFQDGIHGDAVPSQKSTHEHIRNKHSFMVYKQPSSAVPVCSSQRELLP